MEALEIVTLLIAAAGASALSTPLVGRLAVALGVVDVPDARKVNLRPNIPLMGGLAVAVGCAAGFVLSWGLGQVSAQRSWPGRWPPA